MARLSVIDGSCLPVFILNRGAAIMLHPLLAVKRLCVVGLQPE